MGDFADMTRDAWVEEDVFDRYIEMNRPNYGLFSREIAREKARQRWESRIRRDEENGVWTTGEKDGRKQIHFKYLTNLHMKNIYDMLEKNRMYIPQYIRNFVKYGRQDFLTNTVMKDHMWRFSVIVLEKKTTCKTCPFAKIDPVICEDDGCYGTGKRQCIVTKEDIEYQYKNEMRGWRCPLKEVV